MGLDLTVVGVDGMRLGSYSTYHELKWMFKLAIDKMMDAKSLKLTHLSWYKYFLKDLQRVMQDPKKDNRPLFERYRADIIKADPTLLEKKTLPFRIGAVIVGYCSLDLRQFDKYLKPMQMVFGPTFIEKERQGSVATFDEVIEQQLQLLVDYEQQCDDEEIRMELKRCYQCRELKDKIEKGSESSFWGCIYISLDDATVDILTEFGIVGFWWWTDHSDCEGYWSTGQVIDIMQMIETLVPYLTEKNLKDKWLFPNVENPVAQDFYLWKLFEAAVRQNAKIEFT